MWMTYSREIIPHPYTYENNPLKRTLRLSALTTTAVRAVCCTTQRNPTSAPDLLYCVPIDIDNGSVTTAPAARGLYLYRGET